MKLVTVKEISEYIKVREKTIYQWAELQQIPHIKLNGALRFDLDDIHDWVRECKKDSLNSYNSVAQARSPKKGGRR